MNSEIDKLEEFFELRKEFMLKLKEKTGVYPEWPVDITKKSSQQFVRDIALRGVEEMFEAIQLLKNAKPHRLTDVSDIDKDAFLEEIVDAFNFFLSVLVLTGFNSDDLHKAYLTKHEKICKRIDEGY